MVNYVNPLAQVASYKNQQLAPALNGTGQVQPNTVPGSALSAAYERMASGQASPTALSGIQAVSDSASRQNDLYMQAIVKRNQMAAQATAAKQAADAAAKAKAAQAKAAKATLAQQGFNAGIAATGNPKGLVGQYELLPGANAAYGQLNKAFKAKFGYNLPIISGGRTYAQQQALYNAYLAGRGNLAAKPGTSEHESGRAVDFGGAAHNAGTAAHIWLEQNAGRYGWKWTGKNFSQFEPWHWEWWG